MNSGPPLLGVRVKAFYNQARLTFSAEWKGALPGPSDSPGTPDLPTECAGGLGIPWSPHTCQDVYLQAYVLHAPLCQKHLSRDFIHHKERPSLLCGFCRSPQNTSPVPVNGILFGNRVLANEITSKILRWDHHEYRVGCKSSDVS